MKVPQSVRELIESGCPAHFVTLNPDGSPQVTLIWVGLDGEEVIAAHLRESQKVKNIRRNPRVVVSLQATTKNAMGLTEYAVLYGLARIEPGGAPELLQRLAHVYMGPEATFPPMDNPPAGFITRIQVTRVAGVGPWTGAAV
ncbi:MAG: PPOX class F420-dependent oxidoreductase [Caldilineales bacterium]|nr:PPOX class F420-dependent oxidoreductase [Caldilineales bacterium]